MKNSNLDKLVKQYILDSIDLACYDESASDPVEAAKKVIGFIMNEADHAYNRKKLVSDQAIIEDYLRGLPSYINIAFTNHDILQLAVKWGSIPENYTDKQAYKITDNYWQLIAAKLIQISNGYHVKGLTFMGAQ